jgi:hypothetical protein
LKERPSHKEIFPREFSVSVHGLDEDEALGGGYVRGEASLEGETFPFNGVAFGRFGGHNINVSFEDDILHKLTSFGLGDEEIENFKVAIQLKLLEGDMDLRNLEGHKHEHDHAHGSSKTQSSK